MRHYLMYRECKISEITKSSEKLRGFFMHKEGVQKVFGTLDLFVSLLETEIKYPILQGGILPFWTPSSFLVFWDGPFVPEYLLSKDYNLLVIYYRFEILK